MAKTAKATATKQVPKKTMTRAEREVAEGRKYLDDLVDRISAGLSAHISASHENTLTTLTADAGAHADHLFKHAVDWVDRINRQLDEIAKQLKKAANPPDLPSQTHREVACIRSDTIALLAMREGDGARLSRLELMLMELTAKKKRKAAKKDEKRKDREQKEKRKANGAVAPMPAPE